MYEKRIPNTVNCIWRIPVYSRRVHRGDYRTWSSAWWSHIWPQSNQSFSCPALSGLSACGPGSETGESGCTLTAPGERTRQLWVKIITCETNTSNRVVSFSYREVAVSLPLQQGGTLTALLLQTLCSFPFSLQEARQARQLHVLQPFTLILCPRKKRSALFHNSHRWAAMP